MFELHDVVKIYGEGAAALHAVDGVSLQVNRGEFVVIEGPSGSGKSTLLQMLGALDRPTAGAVYFEGNDLATLPDKQLAQLRLRTFGFVFQQFNLVPTLSAVENVEAALAPLKGSPRKKRERAMRLLNGVGLAERADHLPSQLSGGEQQRVAIARALSKGPRVILADEPTGNLDTRTGKEIMQILYRLSRDNGQTVILITHDPEIAARAPRVVRVRDGRIVADASGRELIEAAKAMPTRPSLPPIVTHAAPTAALQHEPALTTGGTLAPAAQPVESDKWVPTASLPPLKSEPLLHAEGVIKHYVSFESHEDVVGIDGVSLIVHPGEFVAITGPSGSGKTTLLNCLSGLDRIDRGRVLIDGHTVHDLSDKQQSHLRSEVMGFIFQNWNLVPVFSAIENVELPLLLNGEKPAAAREQAKHTLERIGLGHRLNHHPNAMSGGEQQRVAIARALAANPKLVWADEPTGNLDSSTAESVMKLLRELNDDGLAIILVTHDESIAEQASRRLFIRDGKLLADMTRRTARSAAPTKHQPAVRKVAVAPQAPSRAPAEAPLPAPAAAPAPRPQGKAERREARRAARMTQNHPQAQTPQPQAPLPQAPLPQAPLPQAEAPLPQAPQPQPPAPRNDGPKPITLDNPFE